MTEEKIPDWRHKDCHLTVADHKSGGLRFATINDSWDANHGPVALDVDGLKELRSTIDRHLGDDSDVVGHARLYFGSSVITALETENKLQAQRIKVLDTSLQNYRKAKFDLDKKIKELAEANIAQCKTIDSLTKPGPLTLPPISSAPGAELNLKATIARDIYTRLICEGKAKDEGDYSVARLAWSHAEAFLGFLDDEEKSTPGASEETMPGDASGDCFSCGGTGRYATGECRYCRGTGDKEF